MARTKRTGGKSLPRKTIRKNQKKKFLPNIAKIRSNTGMIKKNPKGRGINFKYERKYGKNKGAKSMR
jgi:hypothetical protein